MMMKLTSCIIGIANLIIILLLESKSIVYLSKLYIMEITEIWHFISVITLIKCHNLSQRKVCHCCVLLLVNSVYKTQSELPHILHY